jgi:hypothetical protein
MITSAREMVEFHREVAKPYSEANRRYPDATCETLHGHNVIVTSKPVDHDRILVDGDKLAACGTIELDGSKLSVVGDRWGGRQTILAVEYLRDNHPDAYAGLIQWLVR